MLYDWEINCHFCVTLPIKIYESCDFSFVLPACNRWRVPGRIWRLQERVLRRVRVAHRTGAAPARHVCHQKRPHITVVGSRLTICKNCKSWSCSEIKWWSFTLIWRVVFSKCYVLWNIWIQIYKMAQVGNSVGERSDCKVLRGEWLQHEYLRVFCKKSGGMRKIQNKLYTNKQNKISSATVKVVSGKLFSWAFYIWPPTFQYKYLSIWQLSKNVRRLFSNIPHLD